MAQPCPNCGAEIDAWADDRCPACDVPLKVVCPNCGEHAPATEEFCPACEASLAHGAQGA